jgi:hypothetical protein
MSTLFQTCSAFENNYGRTYIFDSREPKLWNRRIVEVQDANGNPLEVSYYYDNELVFTTLATYNSQSKETSFEVYQP